MTASWNQLNCHCAKSHSYWHEDSALSHSVDFRWSGLRKTRFPVRHVAGPRRPSSNRGSRCGGAGRVRGARCLCEIRPRWSLIPGKDLRSSLLTQRRKTFTPANTHTHTDIHPNTHTNTYTHKHTTTTTTTTTAAAAATTLPQQTQRTHCQSSPHSISILQHHILNHTLTRPQDPPLRYFHLRNSSRYAGDQAAKAGRSREDGRRLSQAVSGILITCHAQRRAQRPSALASSP